MLTAKLFANSESYNKIYYGKELDENCSAGVYPS